MKIKTNLIGFALFSLLFMLCIGASGIWTVREMTSAAQKNAIGMAAMRHHLAADMMHDALRGDVLSAALAGTLKQSDKRGAMENELTKHLKSFQQALKSNEALPLRPEIQGAMAKLRPLVDGYLKDAQATVAIAFDSPGELESGLPKFLQTYGILEKEMGVLSDLIEKDSIEATATANATSAFSEKLT